MLATLSLIRAQLLSTYQNDPALTTCLHSSAPASANTQLIVIFIPGAARFVARTTGTGLEVLSHDYRTPSARVIVRLPTTDMRYAYPLPFAEDATFADAMAELDLIEGYLRQRGVLLESNRRSRTRENGFQRPKVQLPWTNLRIDPELLPRIGRDGVGYETTTVAVDWKAGRISICLRPGKEPAKLLEESGPRTMQVFGEGEGEVEVELGLGEKWIKNRTNNGEGEGGEGHERLTKRIREKKHESLMARVELWRERVSEESGEEARAEMVKEMLWKEPGAWPAAGSGR